LISTRHFIASAGDLKAIWRGAIAAVTLRQIEVLWRGGYMCSLKIG
jgi:hypothetical protein